MTHDTGDLATGRRVLVVEDNADIRQLLNLWLLDDPRCESVTEAADVASALEATRTARYDTVVLDFLLPDGTAVDCLPHLRKAWPQAWILVNTATVGVAHKARLIELGADVVVQKVAIVVDDVADLVLGSPEVPDAAA